MDHNAIVYLNGDYLPLAKATISVLDRGFLFGDGVYEVIPIYGGRPFRLEQHLDRLQQSLAAVRIANPLAPTTWRAMLEELVTRNGGGDLSLYLQVSRGVGLNRDHAFPAGVRPTLFAMTQPLQPPAPQLLAGVTAITVEDLRWSRCDIKATSLLPNVLTRQAALDAGALEAIMLRAGEVTEGATSNLFTVHGGQIRTPPQSQLLLPGITRDLVVELCQRQGLPCAEAAISEADLRSADEIWLSSSTKELLPVVTLDGVPVGCGQPGVMWQLVIDLYRGYKEQFRRGEVT